MIALATGALMSAVWQGILLAVVVWLGLRLLPKTPAAVRFAIWFGVFLVVAALPLIALWPNATGASKLTRHAAWVTFDPRWGLAIAAVWGTASALRAGTLAMAALRVRALWKRATPLELPAIAGPNPGSRQARLCTSDEVDRPTVIGFFSPKILIPEWLLEKLTPAELEQIVLHESEHLGRADDWMNLLQKIALVIFPLNPALAWVERRLCFERELAVDERVLRTFADKAGAATAYAACLTNLAEHRLGRRGLALALGALGRESQLGRRVKRILRRGDGMKPLHARLVLGGAMLGLVVAAIGMERCPELVGFGSPGAQPIAQITAQRGEIAQNGWPKAHVSAASMAHPLNVVQRATNVPHQVLLVSPQPVSQQTAPSELGPRPRIAAQPAAPSAPHMVQTNAHLFGSRNRVKVTSDVEPSPAATGLMEWVTVTSWQREDGSRMVLATERTAALPESSLPVTTGYAPELRPQNQTGPEQVHSYAAVPVRGGWLVIQL
jgi:hypothetical protein